VISRLVQSNNQLYDRLQSRWIILVLETRVMIYKMRIKLPQTLSVILLWLLGLPDVEAAVPIFDPGPSVIQNPNAAILSFETVQPVETIATVADGERTDAEHRTQEPVEGPVPVAAQSLHHQPYEMPNGNFLAMTANARQIELLYSDPATGDHGN
jgi:hypothetical protein